LPNVIGINFVFCWPCISI